MRYRDKGSIASRKDIVFENSQGRMLTFYSNSVILVYIDSFKDHPRYIQNIPPEFINDQLSKEIWEVSNLEIGLKKALSTTATFISLVFGGALYLSGVATLPLLIGIALVDLITCYKIINNDSFAESEIKKILNTYKRPLYNNSYNISTI